MDHTAAYKELLASLSRLKEALRILKEHEGELYVGPDGRKVEGEEKIQIENALYKLILGIVTSKDVRRYRTGYRSGKWWLN